MTTGRCRGGSVASADGTAVTFETLGDGPGLILVGGVLTSASTYAALADALSPHFTVHVVNRRGRPPTGPQRPRHGIAQERDDLLAVAAATGAQRAFGHSFGGLVVLETARRFPVFDELFLYEPGVSIAGSLVSSWLDDYEAHLSRGDLRGAFASMVKGAGFAPRALTAMPLWYIKAVLRVAIRGARWRAMERLLQPNLTEHRIIAALDAPDASRFLKIGANVHLLGGERSSGALGRRSLDELASNLPRADVQVLPGLGHLAPQDQPTAVAGAIVAGSQPSAVPTDERDQAAAEATSSAARPAAPETPSDPPK